MKKFTTLFAVVATAMAFANSNSQAQTYMNEATLDYPSGLYSSFPPFSATFTWNDEEIELINPETDENGEEYVNVNVRLGEGEAQTVGGYIMYSFGNPEDPEDKDFWGLDVALYNLEDLFDFQGNTITISLPEGIVKNKKNEINPSQEFVFHIMPTYTGYTVTPETGATLNDNLTIKIQFGGNALKYNQAEVRAVAYDPEYKDIPLSFGEKVKITENNEIEVDLSSLDSGYYELIIPEGYVFVTSNGEDYLSPDIWLEYTIKEKDSGIQSLETNSSSSIYTVSGIKVRNNNKGNEEDKLPNGLYIINGKKIIRK